MSHVNIFFLKRDHVFADEDERNSSLVWFLKRQSKIVCHELINKE